MNLSVIIGVLLYLLNHEKTSAQKLAEMFEISTRTVYRYLDNLSLWGIPVVTLCGRNGGIYVDQTYSLKNVFFTKNEIDMLLKNPYNDNILTQKLLYLKKNIYS